MKATMKYPMASACALPPFQSVCCRSLNSQPNSNKPSTARPKASARYRVRKPGYDCASSSAGKRATCTRTFLMHQAGIRTDKTSIWTVNAARNA